MKLWLTDHSLLTKDQPGLQRQDCRQRLPERHHLRASPSLDRLTRRSPRLTITLLQLVLIGIACTGPLFALLLSNPHQVRRSNGTPVEYTKTPINLLTEFKAMFHLAKQPTILLL